jgi:hypothetical protein
VLYFAVVLAILGTLLTAGGMSAARDEAAAAEVEIQQAVKLAVEVQGLCADREFEIKNPVACHQAAELLADPSPSPGGVGGAGDLIEAVGIPR